MFNAGKIIWLPHSKNPVFAGVRLRCLIPQAILKRKGCNISIASAATDLTQATVIVVQAKWLLDEVTPERLLARMARLQEAKSCGVLLLLDSFDNYFTNATDDPNREQLLAAYKSCLKYFDHYIVSSSGLIPILANFIDHNRKISIIGDPLEGPKAYRIYEPISQRLNPRRWIKNLAEWQHQIAARNHTTGFRKLMWFGNHGSAYAGGGMGELTKIFPKLQDISSRVPLHLTIVSNSWQRFEQLTTDCRFPCSYFDWDRLHFSTRLEYQDLVLLPSQLTDFTKSKSNNRLLLSLSHGVPVIADALPDYVEWRDHCALDDWDNLESHIINPLPLRQRAIAATQKIKQRYSPETIADDWLRLIKEVTMKQVNNFSKIKL